MCQEELDWGEEDKTKRVKLQAAEEALGNVYFHPEYLTPSNIVMALAGDTILAEDKTIIASPSATPVTPVNSSQVKAGVDSSEQQQDGGLGVAGSCVCCLSWYWRSIRPVLHPVEYEFRGVTEEVGEGVTR